MRLRSLFLSGLILSCATSNARLFAQAEHDHHGGDASQPAKAAPKVFLDKSPKIVEYQLKRLSNSDLLLIEREPTDKKFIPVYAAILSRAGMPVNDRREAAEALAKIKSTAVTSEILAAIGALPASEADTPRVVRDLTNLLLSTPNSNLSAQRESLSAVVDKGPSAVRRAALAGLIKSGASDVARTAVKEDAEKRTDLLAAVAITESAELRDAFRGDVLAALDSAAPSSLRTQAIKTLGTLTQSPGESFELLAKAADDASFKAAAVSSMLKLPSAACATATADKLTAKLVSEAVQSPIDVRSSDAYLDAAQLAENLLPRLSDEVAKGRRKQLREAAVRVVRIRTVEEEMRYDQKWFAVEAGKPVEIVLINEDLMPHNLVITVPGAVKEVALTAATMAPDDVTDGKQYVPRSEKVLHATKMAQAGKQDRLAFTAPTKPGEYPFVCTFPNHWMRMVGVMVVVEDLDAFQKDPKAPADPIGNNRSFVRKWTADDLVPKLPDGLRGRSAEIGKRLFQEASCAQCHKLNGGTGNVGPDLSDVAVRWKGDTVGILGEILDPSRKIDPKYAAQSILTTDGKAYSGIIVAEDKDSVSLVSSPDQKGPLVIPRDNIEEIVKSPKSVMPSGLLDQYTQDEIFEILALFSQSKP